VVRATVVSFRAHRGMFLASGLSFTLLTCLIPVLFFVVSLAGFVLSRRAAAEAVLSQLSQIVPVYKEELHQVLAQIIRRRNLSGILGTAVLVVIASQVFASLRLVLDEVFGFTRGQGFVRGLVKDLLLLLLMGVLFLASVVVTDLFGWLKILLIVPFEMPPEWIQSAFIGLAVGVNTALFFVAYRYFPHRKVPAGAALAGALLASVLWETAKQLFRWYILSLGVYDRIYGPLGALVALSMFAYYSGIVFVLGAEFTAALLKDGRGRRQGVAQDRGLC
jgi:membrane protein